VSPLNPKIVAIDGPAGSGKSSICLKTCKKIGWNYVNTGSIYRAVAALAIEKDIDVDSQSEVETLVDDFSKHMSWDKMGEKILYKQEDFTSKLHSRETTAMASLLAKHPYVRSQLLPLQRKLAEVDSNGLLVDGRDIGTVVFPNADLKIFMTASLEERARRRLNQILEKSKNTTDQKLSIDDIAQDIEKRDAQDSGRGNAPLKKAEDAILFDNSNMGVEEAVSALVEILRSEKLID
jgi:cytidylate kinase